MSKKVAFIFLFLAIIIFQVFIGTQQVNAAGNVIYQPKRQKYAIAPAALYKNADFYNQYVKTDEKWAFNSITYFTNDNLNYSTEKLNYNKDFEWDLYFWDPILEYLREKGQLYVNLRVCLANAKSAWYSSKISIQDVYIPYYRDYYGTQDSNDYVTYGDMDYFRFTRNDLLKIYFAKQGDRNNTLVKNTSLVFADTTAPEIHAVYATTEPNPWAKHVSTFKEGSIYIHIKFDEYIRFSDNRASHDDVYLKLKVARIEDGVQVTSANERAKLYSLKDDTLTFKYDIPQEIAGEKTNHYIYGFYGIFDANNKNILNAGENAYLFRVLTHTGELYGHWLSTGLLYEYRSRSLITDLAGNPSVSTSVPDTKGFCVFMDTVEPTVKKVSLTAVGSKSQYIGVGGSVTPSITFSEPLYSYDSAGNLIPYQKPNLLRATLNIKDKDGNYISVIGKSFDNDKNTVTFNNIIIREGMSLEEGADRIKIKDLSYTSSAPDVKAYDRCGNPLNTQTVVPENQFLIDTEIPSLSTDMSQTGDSRYKPVVYDSKGGDDGDSFYFSFNISDALSGLLPRGTETLNGSITWSLQDSSSDTLEIQFQYAVTNSPNTPSAYSAGKFGESLSFPQYASTLYFHVKAADVEKCDLRNSTITITAKDIVSNTKTEVFELDGSDMMYIIDKTAPTVIIDKLYTYQHTDGTWRFAASFTMSDKGLIDTSKVKYLWTTEEEEPSQEQMLPYEGLGADAETVSAEVYKELAPGQLNEYYLYISVTDASLNENTTLVGPYKFSKNLSAPLFTSEVSGDLTQSAALKLNMPEQTITQTVDGEEIELTAVALIMLEENNGWSVRTIEADEDISIDNVFSNPDVWLMGGELIDKLLKEKYYGETKVIIVAGYGIEYRDGNVYNLYESVMSEESYTLYTAPAQELEKIHNITMTSSLRDLSDGWTNPDDGPKYYTDLAGATFNIVVENSLMKNWGSKDTDFSSSYFALYRENDGSPVLCYQTQLGMQTQVTIPELNFEPGRYFAKAVVAAKTSGQLDAALIENIVVDKTKPADFGLSKTETSIIFNNEKLNELINTETRYYGYDAIHNPMDEVEDKSYGSAPYLYLGSAVDEMIQSITHRLYFTTLSDNNDMYIKLWNASEGIEATASRAASRWVPVSNTSIHAFTVKTVEDAASVISNYSEYVIPLINNTENILYYQICHANGEISGERALLINVNDEKPVIEVALSPENEISREVTAVVTRLESESTPDMNAMYWNGTDSPIVVTESINLLQTDNNWFYAKNMYGSYTFVHKTADHLDIVAPVITTSQATGEGDGYAINVSVSDKNQTTVKFKFDDAYMARLGFNEYFDINIPEENGEWLSRDTNPNGIYKIERKEDTGGAINLTIYGVYLYDETKPDTVNLGYSIYAKDIVGNENEINNTIEVKNIRPFVVKLSPETIEEKIRHIYIYNDTRTENEIEVNLHSVTAYFNLPVKNITPFQHHNESNDFSLEKPFLSIFKDGTHTIKYDDIFGNSYTEEKEVAGIEIDMKISLGGADVETGKYGISIAPVANESFVPYPIGDQGTRFSVFADYYESSLFFSGYARILTAHKVDWVEFDKNEDAIIIMMEYRPAFGGWFVDLSKPVIIIDGSTRQAPPVTVNWYYHEFASNDIPEGETCTDGNIDVWITADRPITGINGKLTTHTFTYGESTGYLFEYEDSTGIAGRKYVEVPIPIVEKKEKEDPFENYEHDDSSGIPPEELVIKDETPPDFYIDIYYDSAGISKPLEVWNSTSGIPITDIINNITEWSKKYVLKFGITDTSKTKVVLLSGETPSVPGITYENAESETVDGISLSGNCITVSKAQTFTVVIIDESDNKSSISFQENLWNKLDSIPPEIDMIEYESTGFNTVIALFTLKDDKSSADEIVLLSPVGTIKDSSGRYVITFYENGSIEITMRDTAGNIGSGIITVDSIDDKPPVAKVAWWSHFLISNGVPDVTKPTTTKTNSSITVKVVFDKNIMDSNINVYYNTVLGKPASEWYDHMVPDTEKSEYATLLSEIDSAAVDFHQNCTVEFQFTGINYANGSIILTVNNIIDKTAPAFTAEITDQDADTSAKVIFKDFSEPVYVYGPGENGNLYSVDDEIVKIFTERGKYTFRFTDEAGNTVAKEIEIENIDEFSPAILLSGLPPAGEYRKDPFTFKATMSEKGTITFQGISEPVDAPVDGDSDGEIDDDECDWVTFEVSKNGSFMIVAEDIAGRRTYSFVNVNCFDNVAPTITFNPVTIQVLDTTDMESLLALLEDGVYVKDNLTAPENINLTFQPISPLQLATPGMYQVVYTATDSVGNSNTAIRYIKVYSANEINVSVNGKRTEASGVTIIEGDTASLSVSKLPAGEGEPYKVYLRKGIWTAGEMKHIRASDNHSMLTFPDKNCYYTLYIVTQNRGTYLTYLFVQ